MTLSDFLRKYATVYRSLDDLHPLAVRAGLLRASENLEDLVTKFLQKYPSGVLPDGSEIYTELPLRQYTRVARTVSGSKVAMIMIRDPKHEAVTLITKVVAGKSLQDLIEFFVDSPTQASLPISQFMQDLIDANEQLKQLRDDLDQLSADMVNFEQSVQIPDFTKAKGTLTWLNNTSDTMSSRLSEVIVWARQHIQKLGN